MHLLLQKKNTHGSRKVPPFQQAIVYFTTSIAVKTGRTHLQRISSAEAAAKRGIPKRCVPVSTNSYKKQVSAMNQDQVKTQLLQLNETVEDFLITFSGKNSTKVDGLYHPENREIIIHNKNFTEDNALMYTAIHEFAHHIQFTESPVPVSSRAHTNHFWNIFHNLLFLAEKRGIYNNVFKTDREFVELTKKIKDNFVTVDAQLMKDFGKFLLEAFELCLKNHLSFDDYVDRELQLHRNAAKTLIKIHSRDISPEIGYENMKMVANIREDTERERAEAAFLAGRTPDMVRAEFGVKEKPQSRPENKIDHLLHERDKIERTIEKLTVQLARIEQQISSIY